MFTLRFDMRAPPGHGRRSGDRRALPRRAGDGRLVGDARLRQRHRVRAPRVERRLPAVAPGARQRHGGAHDDPARSRWRSSLLPLYDPVRLAEEMVVLDMISKGRVIYVAAIGYRPVEYEMYGVDYHRAARSATRSSAVPAPGQDR